MMLPLGRRYVIIILYVRLRTQAKGTATVYTAINSSMGRVVIVLAGKKRQKLGQLPHVQSYQNLNWLDIDG